MQIENSFVTPPTCSEKTVHICKFVHKGRVKWCVEPIPMNTVYVLECTRASMPSRSRVNAILLFAFVAMYLHLLYQNIY